MILSNRTSGHTAANPQNTGFMPGEDDLESTVKLPAVDRRINVRYPRGKAATSCLITDAQGNLWPAEVRDISMGGMSMVLLRPVERGAVLNIELANKLLRFNRRVQLRALHIRPHPEGGWIIGGAFSRKLTASELQALV